MDQDPKLIQVVPPVRRKEPVIPRRYPIKQLPIVGEHYWVQSLTATTTTVRRPSTGMKLRLNYVHVSAKGVVYIFFQFHSHNQGTYRICPAYMGANTVFNANLVGAGIEGEPDEDLEIVTDAAQQLDVMVVLEEIPGKVVGEKPQEE